MTITITTLSENTATALWLLAEWGLSILVESNELTVLLDTGLSISAVHNANKLGVDLKMIDKIVLSHGHIDHTGGLKEVLSKTGKVEVIAHPDVWQAKYSRTPGYEERNLGIPFAQKELEELGASFTFSREPIWMSDNILTTGEIPMVTEYEEIDPNLYVKEDSKDIPDKLLDDRALIIKTDLGLVVILGCAHRGLINTLYHARDISGEKRVYAVVGGTHLLRASEKRLTMTIAELKGMGIQRVGVSHCTGSWPSILLAQELGQNIFFFNNAGTRTTIP